MTAAATTRSDGVVSALGSILPVALALVRVNIFILLIFLVFEDSVGLPLFSVVFDEARRLSSHLGVKRVTVDLGRVGIFHFGSVGIFLFETG